MGHNFTALIDPNYCMYMIFFFGGGVGVSGVVVVERLERSLQFLFSRVERRSSFCFTCFLSILLVSCRMYYLS